MGLTSLEEAYGTSFRHTASDDYLERYNFFTPTLSEQSPQIVPEIVPEIVPQVPVLIEKMDYCPHCKNKLKFKKHKSVYEDFCKSIDKTDIIFLILLFFILWVVANPKK